LFMAHLPFSPPLVLRSSLPTSISQPNGPNFSRVAAVLDFGELCRTARRYSAEHLKAATNVTGAAMCPRGGTAFYIRANDSSRRQKS
jgi:hypothetical protein